MTDQQLQHRALTGVAPDGSVKINKKTGQPVVPPLSSAFHSDRLLIETDQAIRSSRAFNDKVNNLPDGVNTITLTPQELGSFGQDLGRGFRRIAGSKLNSSIEGAAQRVDNLTSAQGTWQRNLQTGQWETITLFPAKVP